MMLRSEATVVLSRFELRAILRLPYRKLSMFPPFSRKSAENLAKSSRMT
jgi:hypothetical protein